MSKFECKITSRKKKEECYLKLSQSLSFTLWSMLSNKSLISSVCKSVSKNVIM